jgi:nicotinate-nucleotide adenylyltransferase
MLRPKLKIAGITEIPPSGSGMRIGLFGGSFNPLHDGHLLVMEESLRRLQLDALWVLVTPGNPLKNNAGLPSLQERALAARARIGDPRIRVTGFEAALGAKYTWQTLNYLVTALPDRRFVWIMGADSLADMHKWERWRQIFATMPIAVYARPGSARKALVSRASATYDYAKRDEDAPAQVVGAQTPAWVYLQGRQSNLSSSAIRAGQNPAIS